MIGRSVMAVTLASMLMMGVDLAEPVTRPELPPDRAPPPPPLPPSFPADATPGGPCECLACRTLRLGAGLSFGRPRVIRDRNDEDEKRIAAAQQKRARRSEKRLLDEARRRKA